MKSLPFFLKYIPALIVLIIAFSYGTIWGIALVALLVLVAAFSKRYVYYFFQGNRLYNSGDIERAFQYYEKSAKVPDSSARSISVYGYLLLKNRNPDKAETILNSLKLDKLSIADRNQAKLNLSLVYWKKNKLDKALELLEAVYKEFKCLTMYESYGYLLILNGDYEKALEINQEAYAYDKSSQVVIDNLGETYYHLNDYAKAYDLYKDLIVKEPSIPEPYYHYALVLKEKGETSQALEMLKKALGFKESYLSEVSHEIIQNAIDELKQHC
ncbi:MAG: tetratricopeptide repeat protein [Bacillota bacterium]|nr:tetratricopeptide repeat protein [Bacillota bacterium]